MSKTKIFLLLLAVALLLSLTVVAFAADGGSEVENPIANQDALESLATADPGTYTLTDDLTLDEGWTSIVLPAGVILEGNGKTITGLTTTLFNEVYGTVKNLTISDAAVTGSGIFANKLCDGAELYNVHVDGNLSIMPLNAGAIAAEASGNITIKDCTVSGTISYTSTTKGVGGIAGFIGKYDQNTDSPAELIILNSTNNASIKLNNYGSGGGTAGFIGQCAGGAKSDAIRISNCTNNGKIEVNATGGNAGGIVGYCSYLGGIYFDYCSNTAEVYDKSYAGGIVSGLAKYDQTVISHCVNTGKITGLARTGGLAGFVGQAVSSAGCRIENSMNTGAVTLQNSGTTWAGGIVGYSGNTVKSLVIIGSSNFGSVDASKGGHAGGILGGYECKYTTLKFEVVANYGNVAASGGAGGLIGATADAKNIAADAVIYATSVLQAGNVTGSVAGGFFGKLDMSSRVFKLNATACVLTGNVNGSEKAAVFMGQLIGTGTLTIAVESVMSEAEVTEGDTLQDNPTHYYDSASAPVELTIAPVAGDIIKLLNDAAAELDGTYPTWENGENGPQIPVETSSFVVTFLDRDGNLIEYQAVSKGDAAIAPDAPVVEGCIFVGWDNDFSNVTANLIVTAQYKAIEYDTEYEGTPIRFQSELAALATATPGVYTIIGDLELVDWAPIVLPSGVVLNGNNHTIKYLTTALFSEVHGTVKNLKIVNANIAGAYDSKHGVLANKLFDGAVVSYVDIINCNLVAFYAGGIAAEAEGNILISDCTVSGTIQSTGKGSARVGGFLGYYLQPSNNGKAVTTIENCTNNANIVVISDSASAAGFLANYGQGANESKLYMTNCVNNGHVTLTGTGGNAGGFFGYGYRGGWLYFNHCTNSGNITTNGNAAGFVSYLVSGTSGATTMADMSYCVNNGQISGASNVGGIVGYIGNTNNKSIQILYSANYGKITGSGTGVGGIVGCSQQDYRTVTIYGCTNHGQVQGADSVGGILGLCSHASNTANLQVLTNYGNVIATNGAAGGILGSSILYSSSIKFEVLANYGNVTAIGGIAGGLVGKSTIKTNTTLTVTSFLQNGVVKGNNASTLIGSAFGQNTVTTYVAGTKTANGTLIGADNITLTLNLTACVLSGSVDGAEYAATIIGRYYGNNAPKLNLKDVYSSAEVTEKGELQADPVGYYITNYVRVPGDETLVGSEHEGKVIYYASNTTTPSYMYAYEEMDFSSPASAFTVELGTLVGDINASVSTEGTAAYILHQAAAKLKYGVWWKNGATYPVMTNLQFTVIFVDKDGEILKEEVVIDGHFATAPAIPDVVGYTFVKWSHAFAVISGDLTVQTIYDINKYTVTFLGKDGDTTLSTQVVEYGAAATAPVIPDVVGYTFVAWDNAFSFVEGDLTVTAIYEINKYTVIFLGKDGSTLSTQIIEHGSAATAPTDVPVVEAYRFDGWDLAFDSIISDLTVTAQYVKTWTVTYLDIAGGVWKVEVYDQGVVPVFPEGPVVAGAAFQKWNPDALPAITEDMVVSSVYVTTPTTQYTVMNWLDSKKDKTKLQNAVTAAGNPDIIMVQGMASYDALSIVPEGYAGLAHGQNGYNYENGTSFRYMDGAVAIYYRTDKFSQAGDIYISHPKDLPREYTYIIFPLVNNEGVEIPVVMAADGATSSSASNPRYSCEKMLASIKDVLGTSVENAIIRAYFVPTKADSSALKDRLTTTPDENGYFFTSSDAISMLNENATNVTAKYTYIITYSKGNPIISVSAPTAVELTKDLAQYPVANYSVAYTHTVTIGGFAPGQEHNAISKLDSASVTLQDNLLVNFKVDAAKLEGKELLGAIATIGDKTYEIPVGKVVDGKYVFSVPVAPHQMNDQIEIQLVFAHDLAGEWCGILTRYSVANYCYNKLSTAEGEFRNLLVSILNYGAAAQVAVDHNVDKLANAKLSDADKLVVNGEINATSTQTEATENHTVDWAAAGLLLNDKIVVRFAFDAASVDGLTVKVELNGHTYTVTKFVSAGEGRYYVYVEGLSAHQLRDKLKVTVLDAAGEVSATLSYSVEVYATKVLARENEEGYKKLSALVRAMMAYGDAAYAYKY